MTPKNETLLILDPADAASIAKAVGRRLKFAMPDDEGSNLMGAALAEICRDWEDMLDFRKDLPPKPQIPEPPTVQQTINALLLTDFESVDEAALATWTKGQLLDAFLWAMTEHIAASDNDDVERLPCPPHVQALRGAPPAPAPLTVLLNGQPFTPQRHILTYEEIARRVGLEQPSVTFDGATGVRISGILTRGQAIHVRQGTVVSAYDTSNA